MVNYWYAPVPNSLFLSYYGVYLYLVNFKKYEMPVTPLLTRTDFCLFRGTKGLFYCAKNIKKLKTQGPDPNRTENVQLPWHSSLHDLFFIFCEGQNGYFTVQKEKNQ